MLTEAAVTLLIATPTTLAAYFLALRFHRSRGRSTLSHPILIGTLLLCAVLLAADMDHNTFRQGTMPLDKGLAAAIVLLAVPLSQQLETISRNGLAVGVCILCGGSVAVFTAITVPALIGADSEVIASLAPKSATAPVASEISARLGGFAGLTAVVAILTGLFGGLFGPTILKRIGVDDDRAVGLALGLSAHAIGTMRALQVSQKAGAFATIGMILNALFTVCLVPMIV